MAIGYEQRFATPREILSLSWTEITRFPNELDRTRLTRGQLKVLTSSTWSTHHLEAVVDADLLWPLGIKHLAWNRLSQLLQCATVAVFKENHAGVSHHERRRAKET